MTKPNMPLAERFELHVDRNGPVVRAELGPCAIWTGATNNKGYGGINIEGKKVLAHRVGFFLQYGRWPTNCALHKCDTPRRVRPDHPFEGDKGDNIRDCVAKGRHRPESMPGAFNPSAKLTAADVTRIRERYAAGGVSQEKLGREYGVTQVTISAIVRWRSRL